MLLKLSRWTACHRFSELAAPLPSLLGGSTEVPARSVDMCLAIWGIAGEGGACLVGCIGSFREKVVGVAVKRLGSVVWGAWIVKLETLIRFFLPGLTVDCTQGLFAKLGHQEGDVFF